MLYVTAWVQISVKFHVIFPENWIWNVQEDLHDPLFDTSTLEYCMLDQHPWDEQQRKDSSSLLGGKHDDVICLNNDEKRSSLISSSESAGRVQLWLEVAMVMLRGIQLRRPLPRALEDVDLTLVCISQETLLNAVMKAMKCFFLRSVLITKSTYRPQKLYLSFI